MADPEVTETKWNTKLLNAALTAKAWTQEHPGFSIPAAAYLAGLATVPLFRLIF